MILYNMHFFFTPQCNFVVFQSELQMFSQIKHIWVLYLKKPQSI